MTKAPGEQVVGGNGGQASSFASLWQSCAALPPHLTFGINLQMKHLLSFSGKADRFEWWTISLITDLAVQLCLIFGFITAQSNGSFRYLISGSLYLGAILSLWLAVAVSVRRLRDRERSPWLLFAALVPFLGWAWYLIECGFLSAPGSKVPRKLVRRTVTAPEAEQAVDGTPH